MQVNPYFYTSKNSAMKSSFQSSISDNVGKSNDGQSEPGVNVAGTATAILVGLDGFAFLAAVAVIVVYYQRKKCHRTKRYSSIMLLNSSNINRLNSCTCCF